VCRKVTYLPCWGKAVLVNGYKCIGHSLCAEPAVGAITMVMASPSMSANVPFLTPDYETSIQNMFIVGELVAWP